VSASIPTRRDNSIDAARGVAIVLVVVGHALEILFYNRPDGAFSQVAFDIWRLIYAAHIPAFFMLAGMSRNPVLGFNSARSGRLIVLAMCAHLITALPTIALTIEASFDKLALALALLLRPLVLGTGFSAPSLWFLVALAGVEWLWIKLQSKPVFIFGALTVLTALAVLCPPIVPNFWSFKDLGPGLMFYVLGAALRDAPRRRFVQLTALAVMSWILATASNKGCYLPHEGWCGLPGLKGQFAPMMAIGAYGDYRLFVVSAISGALAIIGVGVAATKSPVGRAAIWAGRNSLNIYLLNAMVLAIANPILKTVPLGSDSSAAVLAVAIVSVLAHGAIAHVLGNPLSAFKSRAFQLADRFLENKRARQSLA
jgi:fucose 4-O-acetylase-like acetyltransferase